MKINVTLELNDTTELNGFSQFVAEVEAYRNPAKAIAAAAAAQQHAEHMTVQDEHSAVGEQVAEAVYEPLADPQVVGHIPPKAPTVSEAEMNAAALKYVEKRGMDKALALVRTFGVAKVGELTDPTKRVDLYNQLMEGAK